MHSPNPIDVGPSRDKETREQNRITGGYNLGSILEPSLPTNSDVRKRAKDAPGPMRGQSPLSSANTASTLSMPLSMSSRLMV